MGYLVTAPLVIVKDQVGKLHHTYHGATIPWLSDEQRDHLLGLGMIQEDGTAPVAAVADQGAVETVAKPLSLAPTEDWIKYGVSQGHNEAELKGLEKPELIELLG
ncbi:Uncharacterised protein [Mycobacteroides abscessus subsp. abscessus]|uniref:hypothetical protein n=1 Tax=Mycobacteroides abscessus TaxID=36809 RepID=UPI000927335E|nr:hypothetical protein [Mycobacteroides abscessus]SIC56369.1 Uncharacterised protein [Mycobacteroides abscessus subsp. abscessus]SKU57743.1 Uncharacterised protein [Mycobacteroides abscessus subsp. abscessus]